MTTLQTVLESKLKTRSTSNLKNDIKTAMDSTDDNSNLIFVFGLNVLEARLSEKEYELFEDSL
ncbi:MAG: hypothetical protein ACJA2M_000791 [Polaribacter sp.]|jgi:hypothetical protein